MDVVDDKWSEDNLRLLAATSPSRRAMLQKMNLSAGANYKKITILLELYDIAVPVYNRSGDDMTARVHKPNDAIFIENSSANTSVIRRRILKLKPHQCESCHRTKWHKASIPLEVHHINGINNDHRWNNLSLLCPNCHSQTSTFCKIKTTAQSGINRNRLERIVANLDRKDKSNNDREYDYDPNRKNLSPSVKANLWVSGKLQYQCAHCDVTQHWQAKPLQLQIDHINGDNTNHSLENLRTLCPNCHAQTNTYRGKNKKHKTQSLQCSCGQKMSRGSHQCQTCFVKNRQSEKRKARPKTINACVECNTQIKSSSLRCQNCAAAKQEKIKWPPTLYLQQRLAVTSYEALGRELGVKGNAIRKRIKNHPHSNTA